MLSVIFSSKIFNLYTFGFFLALGVFYEVFIIWRRLKDLGLKEERVLDFLMISLLWGLFFSRLFYILQNFNHFGFHIIRWLSFISFPGFSFLGWPLGFLLSLFWFVKKEKWEIWRIADEIVFGLLPFLIFFQLGSFLDGSGFGQTTNMPWGIYFPGSLLKRHPISLFSAALLFLIWFFLIKIERHWRIWPWYKKKQGSFISLSAMVLILLTHLPLVFLRETVVYFYWLGVGLTIISLIIVTFLFFLNTDNNLLKKILKKKTYD